MDANALNHLRNEHQNINSLLHILERQLDSIKTGDRPDYFLMHEITQYLTYYSDHYHHPFEDLIYARLVRKNEKYFTVVANIGIQHQEIASKGENLHELVSGLIRGSVISRETLFSEGFDYINLYRIHMLKEETELFQPISEHLNNTDWMLLTSAFEWRPDPVFSDEVTSEYKHLKECISSEVNSEWPWNECLEDSCSICSSVEV